MGTSTDIVSMLKAEQRDGHQEGAGQSSNVFSESDGTARRMIWHPLGHLELVALVHPLVPSFERRH